MTDLAARAEVVKLAADLGSDVEPLLFLAPLGAESVAELRRTISRARFAKIEPRLRRLAASSRLLPIGTTAKIAQGALGARLCGRVAGVLDIDTAVAFAAQYRAPFLAELSVYLDPERTADVIAAIPTERAIEVGVLLLEQGHYLTLGRLVSVAPEPVVEGVIASSTPAELLRVAFYADDRTRVDAVIAGQSDERLAEFIEAALEENLFDEALTLLKTVDEAGQARLIAIGQSLGPEVAAGFTEAADRLGVEIPVELRA